MVPLKMWPDAPPSEGDSNPKMWPDAPPSEGNSNPKMWPDAPPSEGNLNPAKLGEEPLAVLERLTREIAQLETSSGRARREPARSSAGCAALDDLLPRGGYAAGCVVEYLRATPACGASTLAWAAAAAAMQATDGFLVVVDTQHNIYPPPLASHGIDLAKVIFVRPESQGDAIWAVDQALRTSAVAAVVAELERIDDRSARRLQLAAESGQSLALLLRGWQARRQPTWAEVQWLVRSQRDPVQRDRSQHDLMQRGRRWHLQLARVRGGQAGRSAVLEMEPLTGKLRLAQYDSLNHSACTPAAQPLPTTQSPSHERTAERTATTAATAQPSQSALYLASQLAHTAHRPAALGQRPAQQSTGGTDGGASGHIAAALGKHSTSRLAGGTDGGASGHIKEGRKTDGGASRHIKAAG
ncbi:MAG: hypothetical protein IT422_03405 [Pirellulaceae bacterium]|nr:hypothetical protein [Pirellulaceae bacterium]